LVSKGGIDRVRYVDKHAVRRAGLQTYGELIAEERYSPAGFKAELGYKDVSLA
jgi:3-hydroxyisobutyrate dehydrogenase-like beta-hydroxyacid dehydrogenase